MNVAIFGGSFDPPHIGHEQIIRAALQKLDIDILFVIPTFLNPFKKKFFAPPYLRYQWVKKLLLPYKKAKIIDYEMLQKHPVSTIETIKYLETQYNLEKIYLIIGADNLDSLSKWNRYEELQNRVEFVVATRNKKNIPNHLQKLEVNANISSTELRKKLDKNALPAILADEIQMYFKENNESQN